MTGIRLTGRWLGGAFSFRGSTWKKELSTASPLGYNEHMYGASGVRAGWHRTYTDPTANRVDSVRKRFFDADAVTKRHLWNLSRLETLGSGWADSKRRFR